MAAGFGLADEEAEGCVMPNRPDKPPGFALAAGRPLVVEDYGQERRFVVPQWFVRQGWVSGVSVPLSDLGSTIGVLVVRSC